MKISERGNPDIVLISLRQVTRLMAKSKSDFISCNFERFLNFFFSCVFCKDVTSAVKDSKDDADNDSDDDDNSHTNQTTPHPGGVTKQHKFFGFSHRHLPI
jgi:hypothetical protein